MRVISITERTFDFSIAPCTTRDVASRGCGATPSGAAKVLAPSFCSCCGLAKRHQAELAARGVGLRVAALAHRDRAVRGDRDVACRWAGTGSGRCRRARVSPALVTSSPVRVDLQRAVAGVALAARRLHHQEGVAVDARRRADCRSAGSRPGSCRARSCGPARSSGAGRRAAKPVGAARPASGYSANTEPSALKPVVFRLAMLLATTSSSRCSAICRDSPMRRVFSIGRLPSRATSARRPPRRHRRRVSRGSPKPRLAGSLCRARARAKIMLNQ